MGACYAFTMNPVLCQPQSHVLSHLFLTSAQTVGLSKFIVETKKARSREVK